MKQVSLAVLPGEIKAVIGPNGAGKTTLFNCITGIYKAKSGSVLVRDKFHEKRNTERLKPFQITKLGIARTFQNIKLFEKMTVVENVMMGCHCRSKSGIWASILKLPSQQEEERQIYRKSIDLLNYFGLGEVAEQEAGNLPYAEQRKLEIARALATDPKILLLDEPAAGMNPQETEELLVLVRGLREKYHLSILLIEHDMKLVMKISDSITVMDQGEVIATGKPEDIARNPKVIRAYLGEESDA